MGAYNFKLQFASAVERGTKHQTIRAERKDNRIPKCGEQLHLYTGMRSKACRLLAIVTCTSVRRIQITQDPERGCQVLLAPERYPNEPALLSPFQTRALAHCDGFAGEEDFFQFFADNHGPAFRGYLIEWRR